MLTFSKVSGFALITPRCKWICQYQPNEPDVFTNPVLKDVHYLQAQTSCTWLLGRYGHLRVIPLSENTSSLSVS